MKRGVGYRHMARALPVNARRLWETAACSLCRHLGVIDLYLGTTKVPGLLCQRRGRRIVLVLHQENHSACVIRIQPLWGNYLCILNLYTRALPILCAVSLVSNNLTFSLLHHALYFGCGDGMDMIVLCKQQRRWYNPLMQYIKTIHKIIAAWSEGATLLFVLKLNMKETHTKTSQIGSLQTLSRSVCQLYIRSERGRHSRTSAGPTRASLSLTSHSLHAVRNRASTLQHITSFYYDRSRITLSAHRTLGECAPFHLYPRRLMAITNTQEFDTQEFSITAIQSSSGAAHLYLCYIIENDYSRLFWLIVLSSARPCLYCQYLITLSLCSGNNKPLEPPTLPRKKWQKD